MRTLMMRLRKSPLQRQRGKSWKFGIGLGVILSVRATTLELCSLSLLGFVLILDLNIDVKLLGLTNIFLFKTITFLRDDKKNLCLYRSGPRSFLAVDRLSIIRRVHNVFYLYWKSHHVPLDQVWPFCGNSGIFGRLYRGYVRHASILQKLHK